MVPGFSNDDQYIMVEDEFYDVARRFTKALHRAEYERLQSLAAAKNASSISEIQRPVDGVTRMSKETLAKQALVARAKKVNEILKGVPRVKGADDNDDDELEVKSQWEGTSLGPLMMSPRKRERDLSARWQIKATTRASAGFSKFEGDSQLAKTEGSGDGVARVLFPTKPKEPRELPKEISKKKDTKPSHPTTSTDSSKPGTTRNPPSNSRLSSGNKMASTSSGIRTAATRVKEQAQALDDTTTDDEEDDDDDLDAPVLKPTKLYAASKISSNSSSTATTTRPDPAKKPPPLLTETTRKPTTAPLANHANTKQTQQPPRISSSSPVHDIELFLPKPTASILGGTMYKGKAMAALARKREQERLERMKNTENQKQRS